MEKILKQTTVRYQNIDALRGLAALYVIFGHALNWYFLNISPDVGFSFEWLKQLTSALAGVFLFFAISGYVIPSSFQGDGYEGAHRFVIRRFFRLYPLFWVSVLPSVIHYCRVANPAYSLETILCNFTMVPSLFNQGFVVGVYWTLVHELLFYALCLLLHCVGWMQQSQKISLLILITGLSHWLLRFGQWIGLWSGGSTFFQKTVLICLSVMLWGALWRCFLDKKCRGILDKIALVFIPVQSLILVICRPFYSQAAAKLHFPISFAVSIALGLAIFMLGTTGMKIRSRVLIWYGKVSYSLYLFHMLVILYVARFFAHFYSHVPSFTLFILVVLAGSSLIGIIGYYFIERPSIAFGKRLTDLSIHARLAKKDA